MCLGNLKINAYDNIGASSSIRKSNRLLTDRLGVQIPSRPFGPVAQWKSTRLLTDKCGFDSHQARLNTKGEET